MTKIKAGRILLFTLPDKLPPEGRLAILRRAIRTDTPKPC